VNKSIYGQYLVRLDVAILYMPIITYCKSNWLIGIDKYITDWMNINRVFFTGIFDDASKLRNFHFPNNKITELRTGTFPIKNETGLLYVYGNNLKNIQPGAFYFGNNLIH